MDWLQLATLIATTGGSFIWARSEAVADRRDALALINAISQEMKDFHGRMCAIEERAKK